MSIAAREAEITRLAHEVAKNVARSAAMTEALRFYATLDREPGADTYTHDLAYPNKGSIKALASRQVILQNAQGIHELTLPGREVARILFVWVPDYKAPKGRYVRRNEQSEYTNQANEVALAEHDAYAEAAALAEPVRWNGRKFGELTPDEQRRASTQALGQLNAELAAIPVAQFAAEAILGKHSDEDVAAATRAVQRQYTAPVVPITNNWTIAIRPSKTRGKFHRVPLALTWSQSVELACYVALQMPQAEVWFVPNAIYDDAHPDHEDYRNVLVPTGRRIAIVDDGVLPFDTRSGEDMRVVVSEIKNQRNAS